jgi:antitoxin component HigA of HigAB toxin-antitoxin module
MWVRFIPMTTTCSSRWSTQLNDMTHSETSAPVTTTPKLRVVPTNGTATQRAATEIRGLMGARKLTAADLAPKLGVSRDTAARRINGDVDITVNELETIAEWLGVPAVRILAPAAGATYSN